MNKELLQQALIALESVSDELVCDATHHKKKDQHGGLAACTNVSRHRQAITALREALAQPVDKAIAQPAEPTLNDLDYESFLAQLTDPDDRMFEQIDLWTRQSYARHKASVRGQMITAGDNVDSHRVWAALRWAKEFAQPVQPADPADQTKPAKMRRDTIYNMATAAHAIDFWGEHFDYVNCDPLAHIDMLQIARLLRNPSEDVAQLRGEIEVMCSLMDSALDVLPTVDGDDDDEDRKLLFLRAKIASAIGHFRKSELLPTTAEAPVALEAVYEIIIKWDENGGKRSRRELARRIVALYTSPQQRNWVGLTDEEMKAIDPDGFAEGFPQKIIAALKAKTHEQNDI